MDQNSNQVPGLGLPQPPKGQGGPADFAQASPVADQAAAAGPSASGEGTDDVLGQEWVEKARDIVEKIKGDPFTASRELHKIKAGYLKARYNKHFKAGEDSAQ